MLCANTSREIYNPTAQADIFAVDDMGILFCTMGFVKLENVRLGTGRRGGVGWEGG